jgi:hypothetical protein
MKLNGRDLKRGLGGDDVKLLHFELKQLVLSIPDTEVASATFGEGTLGIVRRFQTSRQLRATGIDDQLTATAINREFDALSVVHGQVRRAGGEPLTAGRVQAFDKDLRSEQLLGESERSSEGRYEIRYSADKFSRVEKRQADLLVRVLARTGEVLFASDVIFNVPTRQTVDIELSGQPERSEFDRYMTDIKPLLERVTLTELTEADIDFVAGETGISEMHLAFLVVPHQHTATTQTDADLFYGLFRD